MKFRWHITFIFLVILLQIPVALEAKVRYSSPQDSAKAMALVEKAMEADNYGDKIVAAAKALQGVKRGRAADNDSIGTVVVRLDSLSQREFIYMALSAAKAALRSVPSIKDFEAALIDISRRKGQDEGFASQFFYGSDWIVDNVYRGNLKEMTEYLDGGSSRTKTLDYVSRHSNEFPALADSATMEKIRLVEYGYRSHRIPHLKKQSIGNKIVKELLQNGDIIIMSPPETDFDIYDIGIVSMENGEPYLIHISRETNEVTLDPYPLTRLFKIESQFFYGYRWLRPSE